MMETALPVKTETALHQPPMWSKHFFLLKLGEQSSPYSNKNLLTRGRHTSPRAHIWAAWSYRSYKPPGNLVYLFWTNVGLIFDRKSNKQKR